MRNPLLTGRQAWPFDPGLLQPSSIVSGMAHGQIGELGVVNFDIEDVSEGGVEEPVAHHGPDRPCRHDRLADKTVEGGQNARSAESRGCDDFQGRIECEMSNEYREPAKHHAF